MTTLIDRLTDRYPLTTIWLTGWLVLGVIASTANIGGWSG